MFNGRSLGSVLAAALPFAFIGLWFVFPPEDDGTRNEYFRQYAGEIIGSTMMVFMTLSLLLATRLRFLERLFLGLDKMYEVHRHAGMISLALLILHFIVIPLAPGEAPPGRAPGYIALGGFVIMTLIALAPRLPGLRRLIRIGYGKWRISHKFIGIFFIMGTAHMLLVDTLIRTSPVLFSTLLVAIGTGIASYLYAELIAPLTRRRTAYRVLNVNRLNAKVAEVVLQPMKKRLPYRAGQFLFIRFKGDKMLAEPHPFTISSSPGERDLRLTIGSAGDFTSYLYENLQTGATAIVEGGYGALDYRQGGDEQIWIAGGIGVTPFISWIRDMPGQQASDRRIDFYYSARTREEALFVDEILAVESRSGRFRAHIFYTSLEGRFTVEDVLRTTTGKLTRKHVYMCGPETMLAAFRVEFRKRGVPRSAIHDERFVFR
jgi:Predicted ferric reductase